MDNQHKHIKGYRDLSQAEIDLMNRIKAHAELTRQLVVDVLGAVEEPPIQLASPFNQEVLDAMAKDLPAQAAMMDLVPGEALTMIGGHRAGASRWVDLADDHLQQGFMALTRAVAQPTTY